MAKPAVLLDTSIFITALLSTKGGSFYILNTFRDRVDFQTSEYVFAEIDEVLKHKFFGRIDMRTKLFLILGTTNVAVLPNRPKREVMQLKKYISEKDAPILASALKESYYLLTLDNEFFNDKIMRLASNKRLSILKPKDFIEIFGK